ncbi:hypothetical protein [Streptacidiphilus cavernicola]|uniref:DUF2797 domain-containing protein n=1 Tax=Streptacidiphilus cavernicola TaxID=3342716 RepID=A0ABV6W3B1_9ACTN
MRLVRLGTVLNNSGVPLGPLGAVDIEGHTAVAGRGVLHGQGNCRALESGSRKVRVQLAGAQLCGACAWPLEEDHPLSGFAVAVTRLETPAVAPDSAAAPDPMAQPAVPAVRAPGVRAWRRAQTAVLLGYAAVREFSWLEQWAQPRLVAMADVAERARRAVVPLVDPGDLIAAACVASMEPGHVGAVLPQSSATWGLDGEALLRQAWAQWHAECVSGTMSVAMSLPGARSAVYAAFGRRRKGRDEALDSVQHLITPLIEQARQCAEAQRALPGRRCELAIPPLESGAWPTVQGDPLTPWQAGVLAVHQADVDWQTGRAVLLAPAPVVDRLAAG